ncbi:MAG TPA: type II secretion system protein [Patescibacteria group bacterium]|nr:type II secretion system protein [Patescibacteria group bacterium]
MKKGFTLIELLVVISIIGILASLTFVSYSGAQKQTRDTQRRSDLSQYRNGLENYAASNNGLYPVHTSKYDVAGFCGSGADLDEFISDCPTDPTTGKKYYYISDLQGTAYILYADLETAGWWYVCSSGKSDTTDDDTEPTFATCP